MTRRAVLIHKTPSSWNKINILSNDEVLHISQVEDILSPLGSNQIPTDIIDTDMYTSIIREVTEILGFEELHIVQGFDPNEKRNWQSAERSGFSRLDNRTIYWSIDEPMHLCAFLDFDLLFTRGRYPHLHKGLSKRRLSSSGVWMHYPATSRYFPHFDRFIRTWHQRLNVNWDVEKDRFLPVLDALQLEHKLRFNGLESEREIDSHLLMSIEGFQPIFKSLEDLCLKRRPRMEDCQYDIVMSDDIANIGELERIYPDCLVIPFVKPSLKRLVPVEIKRTWDLVFCGTSLQSTKNHMLFGNLLKHIDELSIEKLRIVVIGNRGNLPAYDRLLSVEYRKLEIEDRGEISRSETLEIFNRSRALLVTSGRDSNPRIISEAAIHGARVIALDLLSDGFETIKSNPLFGAIIPSTTRDWFYTRNGNLECFASKLLAEDILNELEKSKVPLLTAGAAERIFNLTNCANKLANIISSIS